MLHWVRFGLVAFTLDALILASCATPMALPERSETDAVGNSSFALGPKPAEFSAESIGGLEPPAVHAQLASIVRSFTGIKPEGTLPTPVLGVSRSKALAEHLSGYTAIQRMISSRDAVDRALESVRSLVGESGPDSPEMYLQIDANSWQAGATKALTTLKADLAEWNALREANQTTQLVVPTATAYADALEAILRKEGADNFRNEQAVRAALDAPNGPLHTIIPDAAQRAEVSASILATLSKSFAPTWKEQPDASTLRAFPVYADRRLSEANARVKETVARTHAADGPFSAEDHTRLGEVLEKAAEALVEAYRSAAERYTRNLQHALSALGNATHDAAVALEPPPGERWRSEQSALNQQSVYQMSDRIRTLARESSTQFETLNRTLEGHASSRRRYLASLEMKSEPAARANLFRAAMLWSMVKAPHQVVGELLSQTIRAPLSPR